MEATTDEPIPKRINGGILRGDAVLRELLLPKDHISAAHYAIDICPAEHRRHMVAMTLGNPAQHDASHLQAVLVGQLW